MHPNPIEQPSCPDGDSLKALALGYCTEGDAAPILAHLESCASCQLAVEKYSHEEPLWPLIAAAEPEWQALQSDLGFQQIDKKLERFIETLPKGGSDGQEPVGELRRIGPYRLESLVAYSKMSAVYKAVHAHLGKTFAVKILPPERLGDKAAVARFRREINLLGKIDHPNVVSATDAGEEDGRFYLAMEYVEGVDLCKLVRRLGPVRVADACELIRQAALGLQAIHDLGCVHRDVKPSNLMLTREGKVKVLDLGLSHFSQYDPDQSLTGTGCLPGTPLYMAPEQFSRSDVDVRADLYSLGLSLWTLLTGQFPPKPEWLDPKEVVGGNGVPVRRTVPLDVLSDIPSSLRKILAHATAIDPDQRFSSAGQFLDAIAPFCNGSDLGELAIRALRPEQPVAPRSKKSPKPAHMLIGGVAVMAVLMLVIMAQRLPQSDSEPASGGNPNAQTGTATSGGTAQETPMQRVVAEWIVRRGGKVKPHGYPEVDNIDRLPSGRLLIQAVDFYDVRNIRDQDVDRLRHLRQLQLLNLSHTSITDRSGQTLSGLASLRYLYLNYTDISDDLLAALTPLHQLELLSIKNTRITDRGMGYVREMSRLAYLDVSGTRVTDEGLGKLATLPSIRTLLLSGTAVTAEGLRDFRSLPELKTLDLSYTQVTDVQVPILRQAANLRTLNLSGTAITEGGWAELRRALPQCDIIR